MQQVEAPVKPTGGSALVITEENSKPTVCSVAQQLVSLSSFARELQTQSHLIHFNYEGGNFFSIHRFLKAQYEAHQDQFDKLSEYVRTLNYWMPMCACGLKDALPEFENCTSYDGREMLGTYYRNLEEFGRLLKIVEPSAHASGAIDVAHDLYELCSAIYKASWMVKATIT